MIDKVREKKNIQENIQHLPLRQDYVQRCVVHASVRLDS